MKRKYFNWPNFKTNTNLQAFFNKFLGDTFALKFASHRNCDKFEQTFFTGPYYNKFFFQLHSEKSNFNLPGILLLQNLLIILRQQVEKFGNFQHVRRVKLVTWLEPGRFWFRFNQCIQSAPYHLAVLIVDKKRNRIQETLVNQVFKENLLKIDA